MGHDYLWIAQDLAPNRDGYESVLREVHRIQGLMSINETNHEGLPSIRCTL
jgi:hypothetical protein